MLGPMVAGDPMQILKVKAPTLPNPPSAPKLKNPTGTPTKVTPPTTIKPPTVPTVPTKGTKNPTMAGDVPGYTPGSMTKYGSDPTTTTPNNGNQALYNDYWQGVVNKGLWQSNNTGLSSNDFRTTLAKQYGVDPSQIQIGANGRAYIPGQDLTAHAQNASHPQQQQSTGSTDDQLMQQIMNLVNGNGDSAQLQALYNQAQQEGQQQYNQQSAAYNNQLQGLLSQYNTDVTGVNNNLASSKADLQNTNFQDYLKSRQDMADRGLSDSGLSTAQNTQLLLANNQNLANLDNQAAQQLATLQNTYNTNAGNIQNELSGISPSSYANDIYSQLYSSYAPQQTAQLTDLMNILKNNQTAENNANTLAEKYWSTGLPYQHMTADQMATQLLNQAKLTGNLNGQATLPMLQLNEKIAQDAATNNIANSKIAFSYNQLNEKTQYDKALIQDKINSGVNATTRTQLSAQNTIINQASKNMASLLKADPTASTKGTKNYKQYMAWAKKYDDAMNKVNTIANQSGNQ